MVKPLSTYLVGGLTVALVTEAVMLKLRIFEKDELAEGPMAKYNDSFMRVLENLKETSMATGFKYKNSSTPREMVQFIATKFPEQKKILNPILASMEAHVYGEYTLTNEDLNNYTRWLSIAPTLSIARAKVRV